MDNVTAQNTERKKIIFSGIQPTGKLTIGNYLGALKNWSALQSQYTSYYCIVDMHAITTRLVPAELRGNSLNMLALYIACGLDPVENCLYIQSHVPAHAQLGWVLGCYTMFGELSRMTQFKDKSAKNADNINSGLFTYPVLMAADILLFQADLVPVGDDQRQHLEIARDIAQRFNSLNSPTFTVPEMYTTKTGTRIMDLQDPASKMSKSADSDAGVILMLDKKDDIMRKFKRAVTDSHTEVRFEEGRHAINNLINIYCAFTGKSTDETEREFDGKGYGDFKTAVGEVCCEALAPIQKTYYELLNDKAYLDSILKSNAQRASYAAQRTLDKVYKKIGFYPAK